MTKITYLDHSGFVAVTQSAILVFDYYRDPANALKHILHENESLPVVFFVTHSHKDHFNKTIFDLAQDHKRAYVLSTDVDSLKVHDDLAVAWMTPGDHQTDLPGGVDVRAFGSTDLGVSYLVTTAEGETLFHAGDLNYWHWQDESTFEQVRKAYGKFVHELQRIEQDVDKIDIVFFPVDPRQGTDFTSGARLFMENVGVEYFFPMHFQNDSKAACSFEDYVTDNTTPICLDRPGQSVELDVHEHAHKL